MERFIERVTPNSSPPFYVKGHIKRGWFGKEKKFYHCYDGLAVYSSTWHAAKRYETFDSALGASGQYPKVEEILRYFS